MVQINPTDPTIDALLNDPESAALYFGGLLLIYGFGAGIYNILGYYNASAKNDAQEYSLRRAAPIFGLAFLGAMADLLIALTFGGASASPVILALVFAGDKVESLIRSIHRNHTPGGTVQDQVIGALSAVVDERDGIEEAFRKIHDAYEQEAGPMDARRAEWGDGVDGDADVDTDAEEIDEGRRAVFAGKPRDPDSEPDADIDPEPEPKPEPEPEPEPDESPGEGQDHEHLHETA